MPAGVFYDSNSAGSYADLTVEKPCGDLRFSRPNPEIPNGVVVRQAFSQLRANYARQAIGTTIILDQTYYLVEETELQDLGGGMAMWDRVWAAVPTNWNKNVVVNKSYQWANYIYSGTTDPRPIVDGTIASWTKAVTGVMYLAYYPGNYGLPYLPSMPFLQFWKFFNSQQITDMGSGFPTTTVFGDLVYSNNLAFSFVSASIEPYMGNIAVLKTIYG